MGIIQRATGGLRKYILKTLGLNQIAAYFDRVMDGTSSGSDVTKKNAYSNYSWVYIATNKIARNIARLDLEFYRGDEKIETHPAIDLFSTPSAIIDKYQLLEGIEIFKQIRGEAFVYIQREGVKIIGFEFLDPLYVQSVPDANGYFVGWKYQSGTRNFYFLPEDVMHFKYFNPDNALRGLSPINAAMTSIEIDSTANALEKKILTNGNFHTGTVEMDSTLDATTHERMRRDIKEMIDKGGIPILDGGAKYKAIALTPQEIQNIERKKLTIDEILSAYEVSKAVVGLTDGFNYANMQAAMKGFWTQKLIPESSSVVAVINGFLAREYGVGKIKAKFNIDGIHELQENANEKIDAAVKLIGMGIPLADVNAKLGLGFDLTRYPWTRTWWVPFSLAPVSMNAEPTPEEAAAESTRAFKHAAANLSHAIDGALACGCAQHKEIVPPADDTVRTAQYAKWKNVWAKARPIEDRFTSKLERFMFELRSEILKNYEQQYKAYAEKKSPDLFNFSTFFNKLKTMAKPFFAAALESGGNTVYDEISVAGAFDVANVGAVNWLDNALDKIKEPLETVREAVRGAIQDGVNAGLTTNEIADDVKRVMNVAKGRAKTIAQTEINSATNAGRYITYGELGVQKTGWVNSFDDRVRDEHNFSEVVEVGKEFKNGLKYPGDKTGSQSTAANVINCRCITEAVFEKE